MKWIDASGNTISTKTMVTTVVTGSTPTSYTAIYEGSSICTAIVKSSGATTLCQGESVTLTSNSGVSYIWKNGNKQVATTAICPISASGAYTVEVVDANGCKATSDTTYIKFRENTKWYADFDSDSKGDPYDTKSACDKPVNYVADNLDLCPSDGNKFIPGNCGCGKPQNTCLTNTEVDLSNKSVLAYPNPFQGEMMLSDDENFSYRILDLSGQALEHGQVNRIGAVGGYLHAGVYLLEISQEAKVKRLKISKF